MNSCCGVRKLLLPPEDGQALLKLLGIQNMLSQGEGTVAVQLMLRYRPHKDAGQSSQSIALEEVPLEPLRTALVEVVVALIKTGMSQGMAIR